MTKQIEQVKEMEEVKKEFEKKFPLEVTTLSDGRVVKVWVPNKYEILEFVSQVYTQAEKRGYQKGYRAGRNYDGTGLPYAKIVKELKTFNTGLDKLDGQTESSKQK